MDSMRLYWIQWGSVVLTGIPLDSMSVRVWLRPPPIECAIADMNSTRVFAELLDRPLLFSNFPSIVCYDFICEQPFPQ